MRNPGVLMVPARTDAYIPGITIPPGRACDDILQVSPTDESQLALHKNRQPYFKFTRVEQLDRPQQRAPDACDRRQQSL